MRPTNNESSDTIAIKTIYGLCNRLRCVFSYLLYARSIGKKLKVYWPSDWGCNGFFLDYFQPVDGVEFFREDFLNGAKYDVCTQYWHEDYDPSLHFLYSPLKLLPSLDHEVKKYIKSLNKYCSVHIRQTDFIRMAKKHDLPLVTNEDFIEEIHRLDSINHYNYIYLATDNRFSQTALEKIFPQKLKYYDRIQRKNSFRHTSLEHAILDIYICANSQTFIGTQGSSFSQLIQQLHNARPKNANYQEL